MCVCMYVMILSGTYWKPKSFVRHRIPGIRFDQVCSSLMMCLSVVQRRIPATTGKTSVSLIHVIKSKERHCGQKNVCGSCEHLTKPDTGHEVPGTLSYRKQGACDRRGDLIKTCDRIPGAQILLKEQRLQQPGRPHQA